MPGQPAQPDRRAGRSRLCAHWSRSRGIVGAVLVDTGPLRRHRDFRRLWGGQLVSQVGSQLTIVAVSYQTYRLTGSTAMVGLVSLGQLVPLLAGSLLGGPLVDAWDRRRVMLFTRIQGGPRLGDAEAGAAAALGGPQFAAWSGGMLSMVTAVVTCWLLPGMWRYDSRPARPGQRGRDAEGRPEPDPVG